MDKQKRILPPVFFLAAILSMAGLHFYFPIMQVFRGRFFFGAILVALGIAVILWAARLFQKAGTTIIPFRETSKLIVSGPYLRSRNPMYLGMVLILTGIGLGLGTLSPFAVIPLFVWVIQKRFITAEEAMLDKSCGPAYAEYKKRIRRWL